MSDGSEDVNDFLQRIKEMGDRRDQEDEERNRKLEADILQARKERQARRAERARSISPTKSSPSTTPTTSHILSPPPSNLSEVSTPTISPSKEPESREGGIDEAMARLTGSPSQENMAPGQQSHNEMAHNNRSSPTNVSPSKAMPSRTPTLSWQQRPKSQASDRSRQRPLSVIATENAARSPRHTPEPTFAMDDIMSRDQIAQSLASKDASWFRQTADRGLSSPAYRKNQVEDAERADHGLASGRMQMPGMSRDGSPLDRKEEVSAFGSDRSHNTEPRQVYSNSFSSNSPLSMSPAPKLNPPESAITERVDVVSSSQGRSSPERLDRTPSPTKGLGGFVQSAMMKRSDSVSKRWSVQSPPGLQRGNSIASNRGSQDLSSIMGERGRATTPTSRPSSSHGTAPVIQERTEAMKFGEGDTPTSAPDNGFVRPTVPASRSRSPTKASWLESALNKPDSPKPKATPPSQQPAWKADYERTKHKSIDLGQGPSPPTKHEVKVGGLLRSPPVSVSSISTGLNGVSLGTSPGPTTRLEKTPAPREELGPLAASRTLDTTSKIKPQTPPKKDFRGTLKSRQPLSESTKKEEPEFKAAFGQLKRTKTQNYVAPDTLKDNITRGKNALNMTGGPVKIQRKDEFREAILKKKDDFKAAQADGKSALKSTSTDKQESAVPEALLHRQALGKGGMTKNMGDTDSSPTQQAPPVSPKPPSLLKETSAPGRLQSKDADGGKLAGRFNPALASLLARGPPSTTSNNSRSSATISSMQTAKSIPMQNTASGESGPSLTHMTKGRARGPRRKAPTAAPVAAVVSPPSPEDRKTLMDSSTKVQSETMSPNKGCVSPKLRVDLTSKQISSDKTTTESRFDAATEPSSPRKLDMKRRSQFLQDVAVTSPAPLNLRSKPSFTGKESTNVESEVDLKKSRPETPTKSPSLRATFSPESQTEQNSSRTSRAAIDEAHASTSMKPNPTMHSRSDTGRGNIGDENSISPARKELASGNSVRAAAAGWSRTPDLSIQVKSPIRLPTHADEKAALIEAGLRSPSPEKNHSRIGLGFENVRSLPVINKTPHRANGISESLGTPTTPRKSSAPPVAVKSPALSSRKPSNGATVLGFFNATPSSAAYTADTASILESRVNHGSNIKTLRSSLFQITEAGQLQVVPGRQERIFFEGDTYFCTHTYGNSSGRKVSEAYYWIGGNVAKTKVDEMQRIAEKEARAANAQLVTVKQGKESSEFLSAQGGIIITRRDSAARYDPLSPHILCGRKHYGHIVFDEVDFSASSLCSGFAYLISTEAGKCYLWKGKGVHADELSCARLIGMDLGMTGDVEEIEEGQEPGSFITMFGPGARMPTSADHWKLKPNYDKYSGRLFLVTDDKEQQITEISPYTQVDLEASRIYVLDAFFEIYIIVGAKSQSQYNAFSHALTFAQEYGILAASTEDRPRVPFTSVVMEGAPKDMKSLFRTWKDELSPTIMQTSGLQRGKSLRVVGLSAALEAVKR